MTRVRAVYFHPYMLVPLKGAKECNQNESITECHWMPHSLHTVWAQWISRLIRIRSLGGSRLYMMNLIGMSDPWLHDPASQGFKS